MISVKNVGYTYMKGTPFEKVALENISFDVTDGEVLAIAGHTGSGKSTLIQIVAGLIDLQSGSVTAWMAEIREDDRRWQLAGGDPELYDAIKSYEQTVSETKKSFEAMERHRKQNFSGGGFDVDGFINRAYSRAMDRDADRIVRELEREGRKYD